jgi:hypothetical protein
MRKIGAELLILSLTVGVMIAMSLVASAQETFNSSATQSLRANEAALRGFDPGLITGHGPTDPWPDTSGPQVNIPIPTELGSSSRVITQQVEGRVNQAITQGFLSQIDSSAGSLSARAHQIETSFSQNEPQQDQIFNIAFSIDAMTDADGNPANVLTAADGRAVSATGSFTQTVKDPVTTAGQTLTCTGTFTFDATNGFVLESGPAGQCP